VWGGGRLVNEGRIGKQNATHASNTSFKRSDNTCASSVGGPGLNLGEQMAGRSRFGTRNPSSGLSRLGSAISALTPHMMVVLPRRTSAEPCAVPIEPV
jgi:hypothetical protein